MAELDELISVNSALQVIIQKNITDSSILQVQNDTQNSQIEVLNSQIEVQNSNIDVLNSQIEVLSYSLVSQIEVENSNFESVNSSLEVQNSSINSQIVLIADDLSLVLAEGQTGNSYNELFLQNNVVANSNVGYNYNILQYQTDKLIQYKSFDFIFFAMIIAILTVFLIVKGFRNV